MKGIVLHSEERKFNYMSLIFANIGNIQTEFNWLITDIDCGTTNEKYVELFKNEYVWMTGKELDTFMQNDDCFWIWGVFTGFRKEYSKEDVLKYDISYANGYTGFWRNPISLQHPLADIEIVQWDSIMNILISSKDSIIEKFMVSVPEAEDLEEYNKI